MASKAGFLNIVIGAKISEFLTKMQVVERQTKKTKASTVMSVGLMQTAFVGAFTAIGMASARLAIDFEKSMTKIQTLVGLSGSVVDAFGKDVLRVSSETGRGAVELADALFVVTSAGLRGSDAMDVLEISAKAARVGLGDTTEIARSLTGVLQAYAKEGLTAAKATEILMATVEQGNLDAAALAPVLGRLVGIAAELGVSFEEVGANLATFTKLGVNADEAATGLRQVMASMLAPTSEAKTQLAEFGMTAQDVRDSIRNKGLYSTLVDLVEITKGNDEALSKIFGNIRALGDVLGTAGAQGEAYAAVLVQVSAEYDRVNKGTALVAETTDDKLNKAINNFMLNIKPLGDGISGLTAELLDNAAAIYTFAKYVVAIANPTTLFTAQLKEMGLALAGFNDEVDKAIKNTPKIVAPAGGLFGSGLATPNSPKSKSKGGGGGSSVSKQGDALKQFTRDLEYNEKGMKRWIGANLEMTASSENSLMPLNAQREAFAKNASVVQGADSAWQKFGNTLSMVANKIQETAEELDKKIGPALSNVSNIVSQLSSVIQQSHQNELNDLTAAEERQVESYKARYKGQEGFEEGMTALLEKQKTKRQKIQLQQAEENKKIAMMQAIVTGAQAVVQALAVQPAPLGMALGAIMAGLVGVQIGVINGAQLPAFAGGGIMPHSGAMLVGERGPEIINAPMGTKITPNHALGGGVVSVYGEFDREKMVVWSGQGNKNHSFRRARL